MSEISKFYVSWEELHKDTKLLSENIKKLGKTWKGILSITRGGLVPAGIVSSELEIKAIETISISSYEQNSQTSLKTLKLPAADLILDGDGWLVIDDLVDTGDTAKEVKKLLPKSTIATIYAKPNGKPNTDIYAKDIEQTTWIVFPWEVE